MKKIFTISLLSLALMGCVSEQEEEKNTEDETSVTPPVITTPEGGEGGGKFVPQANDSNQNLSFVFLNKNNGNCNVDSNESLVYSFANFSTNNNVERATLEISYNYQNTENPKKDITNYIKNIENINEIQSDFEDKIMNEDCAKVSLNFDFDDLPADFLTDPNDENTYGDASDSETSYVIKEAVTLTLKVYSSNLDTPTTEEINIDVLNSNTLPATEKLESISKTIVEGNDSIIFENIYDENFNDEMGFRLELPEGYENLISVSYDEKHTMIEGTEYRKLYKTESDIESKSLNNRLNLTLSAQEISSVNPQTLNFSIIVTDKFVENNENNGITYQEKTIPVNLTIENIQEDLFPSLSVNSSETISERNGGQINFTVDNSSDSPNTSLSVNYLFEIDNAQYTENFVFNESEKSGYIELSDINISGDQEGIMTITVDDGVNTVSKDVIVTLEEDLDRNPTIAISGSGTVNISEENGGSISFTAQNNNPNNDSLILSYDINLPNPSVNVSLNQENQTISFSNISIQNDYSTTLTLTASDGVATVSDTVNVVFVDDIDSEFLEFKAEYENEKLKYNEIQRDDELVIFEFVKEFSQIQYLQQGLINQYETQVNNFLNGDKTSIDNLVNKIDGFIAKENSYTSQEFDNAKANLSKIKAEVSNYGLESLDVINNLIAETSILPPLVTSKNEVNEEGYYSRYVGNSAYGSYLDQERRLWQFSDEFKFLELVNIQNGQCK